MVSITLITYIQHFQAIQVATQRFSDNFLGVKDAHGPTHGTGTFIVIKTLLLRLAIRKHNWGGAGLRSFPLSFSFFLYF
jgi:hypothetical protein